MTPTDVLLDHLSEVRAATAQAGGPSGAWSILEGTCPEIAGAMSRNTFRTITPVVLATAARLAPEAPPAPRTFRFWTVGRDRGGLIRLHRKFSGKLKSVYIGKVWDEAKARERTEAVELGLRHG